MNKVTGRSSGWRMYLISTLLLLFVLRLALPQYIKYLLFPLLAIAGIFAFVELVKSWSWNRWGSKLSIFLPLSLVSLFYLIAFFMTIGKPSMLIRDFVNVSGVFTLLFAFLVLINTEKELNSVLSRFSNSVVIASTIVASLGLVKLYYQLLGIKFDFLKVEGFGYPDGTSLAVDDNFFTLVCIFGIIFSIPLLLKRNPFYYWILMQLSLIALLFNIFFSTSRRGIIVAYAVMSGFIIVWGVSVILKNEKLKQFRKNTIGFGIVSLSLISTIIYLLLFVSSLERNKRLLFSKFNQAAVHTYVNSMILSTKSIFKGRTEYQDVNSEIWQINFDPRYPFSGWVKGVYTPLAELPGENVGIVPKGVIGAKIDKTAGGLTRNGNAYYLSKFFDKKEEMRKRYLASVYCYVSPEFNGDWVRISSHGDVKGLTAAYYDLNQKGKWQKLETSFYADSGSFLTYLYLSKLNANSLDSLNGYVVFAYPELKEISFDPKRPLTWAGAEFDEVSHLPGSTADIVPEGSAGFKFNCNAFITEDSLKYAVSNVFSLSSNDKKLRNIISIYAYVSEDFNGDEVYIRTKKRNKGLDIYKYNLARKGRWEKLLLSISPENANVNINIGVKKVIKEKSDSLRGYVLFAYPNNKTLEFDPKDPITWAANKYKELINLPGKNSEIIPNNSIGYLIDNESDFVQSRSLINYVTYTSIGKMPIVPGKRYISSVYCYVSKDFNGGKVRLGVPGNLYGSRYDYYDLNKKEVWQRLYLNNYGDSGYVESFLYFEIPDNKAVKSLKGYVVFAYPEFNVVDYSPGNPTTYSKTNFKREFPLKGDNSDIVPKGVVGYQLDRTAIGTILKNICHLTTDYLSIPVTSGDSIYASVFCYVSREFNGNEVRLQIRGNIRGSSISRYDFKNIGRWVKLEIKGQAIKDGRVTGVLFFSKKDVPNFNTLNGYVTFAYPIIKVLKPGVNEISYNVKNYDKDMLGLEKATLFSLWQVSSNRNISYQDSLNVIPEFHKEMVNNNFAGSRLDRWRYALYVYKNEYNFSQKLIGASFGYTRKFAKMFFEEERDFDYPHNPFLSVLLYSGLIGLIAYLWFIYKVINYYWIYRREYWPFALCFVVASFFAFFSANSPFDPAILGVLSILPYIIHYNHLKGEG